MYILMCIVELGMCVYRCVNVLFVVSGRKMRTKHSRRLYRCMTRWWRRGLTGETTWKTSSPENGLITVIFFVHSYC